MAVDLINNGSLLVSVIVLTYQSEIYINQTINSILSQNLANQLEIIISDDNSSDSTLLIIKGLAKYNSNIHVFTNKDERGIIFNFKNAINKCRGKYIAYCGHDDFWHNESKLKLQIDFLESHPGFGLVHTDYDLLNIKKNIITKSYNKVNRRKISQGDISQDIIFNYPICSCTPCFRKDIFDEFVPIGEFVKHKFPVEDWCTYTCIALFSKIGYLPISTATFRVGHTSESNPNDLAKAESYMNGHERMFTYFVYKFPESFKAITDSDYRVYKYTSLLAVAINAVNFRKAKIYATELGALGYSSKKTFISSRAALFYTYSLIRKVLKKFI